MKSLRPDPAVHLEAQLRLEPQGLRVPRGLRESRDRRAHRHPRVHKAATAQLDRQVRLARPDERVRAVQGGRQDPRDPRGPLDCRGVSFKDRPVSRTLQLGLRVPRESLDQPVYWDRVEALGRPEEPGTLGPWGSPVLRGQCHRASRGRSESLAPPASQVH